MALAAAIRASLRKALLIRGWLICASRSRGSGIGRIRGPAGADGTGTCSNGDDQAQTDDRSGLFDPSFVLFVLRPGAAQTDSSATAYGRGR